MKDKQCPYPQFSPECREFHRKEIRQEHFDNLEEEMLYMYDDEAGIQARYDELKDEAWENYCVSTPEFHVDEWLWGKEKNEYDKLWDYLNP